MGPEYPSSNYLCASPTVQATRGQTVEAATPVPNEPVLSKEEEFIPPAIVAPGAGSWTHWIEATLEDRHTPCFEQIGTRRIRTVEGTCYFNRSRCRFLYFDDEPAIPSNYKAIPRVWGQPIGIRHINGRVVSDYCDMSMWMYRTEMPEHFDEGRVYTRARSPE